MDVLRRARVHIVLLTALYSAGAECKSEGGLYAFNVRDIRNEVTSLERYRGKISLVVNVASECGYTDEHYKQLTALYKELAEDENKPFTVLAFPCNQFGNQEPHDHATIDNFAKTIYGITFPLFGKINVMGNDIDPMYGFIKRNHGNEPTWNFWKYLINEDGAVIGGWGPRVSVNDIKSDILDAIDKLMSKKHNEL